MCHNQVNDKTNVSARLLALKQNLDDTMTCEFSQSLVIKNRQEQVLCTINYADDNDIYVMTFKENVYVFTSDDVHKLNKFVRFGDQINDSVTKILAAVNVLNLPSTSVVNLDSCTASVNSGGLSIIIIFNFWSLEQIINDKILVITETKSKNKNASNLDINQCAKYLESQVAPTFFVPNDRVRRVRIKGREDYLVNQSSVSKTHIFDDNLYDMNEDQAKAPSEKWLREKNNAIRAYDKEITSTSSTPDAILNKCLNGGSASTANNSKTFINDFVDDDYVYNEADFEDYSSTNYNYVNHIANNNYVNYNENKNEIVDITKNITELNFYEKEILMNLHSINLTELKNVYDNNFTPKVKVILDYFDAFTDEAIDSIREILKSCEI